MTESDKRLILEALENGDFITIVYYSGSLPGTSRRVMPVQANDIYIRAKCLHTDVVHTFMYKKMELVHDGEEHNGHVNWWKMPVSRDLVQQVIEHYHH